MNRIKDITLLLFLFSLYGGLLQAQDISELKNKKPFQITGGIGAGMDFYASNEHAMTRDPFAWNINGSLTPSVYGFSMPLSFSISQYSKSYSAPFAMTGISPTYKWITVHAGYRTMSLSPYIFDGQTFLGGGVELKPGIFRLSGFYGRLNKSITQDTTLDQRVEPQYSRKGYGGKIGLEKNGNSTFLTVFHAEDDPGSVGEIQDSLGRYKPMANTAIGLNWQYNLFKVLNFSGNIAGSLINRDMRYEELEADEIPEFTRSIHQVNASSTLSFAGRARLTLYVLGFNVALGYHIIQPDYLSLGTPYMMNDLENYNINIGGNLFKRINLNGSYSSQHNNLSGKQLTEIKNDNANFSLNFNLGNNFNFNANFNAVKVLQKDGLLILTDSTRLNQFMYNIVMAPTFNYSKGDLQHSISSSFIYTDLKDYNTATSDQSAGNSINASLNYDVYITKSDLGVNGGIDYSVYGQSDLRYRSTGINIGGNTRLLKNKLLSVSGTIGYYFNKMEGEQVGNNTTFSVSANYNFGKQNFGLHSSYVITPPINLNPLDKINQFPTAVNSRNFAFGINYSYSF